MSAQILDGKSLAQQVLLRVRTEVQTLGEQPCVAFVRVGEHPASATYVNKKQQIAESCGIKSRLEFLPETATTEEIIQVVRRLGNDPHIHGILVQSPLPAQVDALACFNAVPSHKDVDGFSAANLGKLVQGDKNAFVGCTPLGILELLEHYKIPTSGQHVVVVGRSLIVGRPLALLLGDKTGANATVTSCNKETLNLKKICQTADILIVAAGAPQMVKADWIKKGAVVIDVGITRVPDHTKKNGYRLVGDVDFESVKKKASAITPVPGGVGPMTVAELMHNTVKAARLQLAVAGYQAEVATKGPH